MTPSSILAPVLALVCWTLVMWFWLYATRIPAMRAIGMHRFKEKKDLDQLPMKVRQVADNYNHLHEQPVIFYALAFYCHLAGTADATNITLAWIYVAIRVIHSVFQAMVNIIPIRFVIFALASFSLMAIAVRNAIAALG
ncbi:MAPEG family protein [Paraliomyxa miuraensis]|uniref:MAPEG family protein n=1 Tax=Paraliomyxa miuraensis TaxID=376150 RepID=UPI00225BA584|nr:MAPEG family protein [Paraliomyxa miuraensis]MCX4242787.1 MAPEG family protein [Paraliomyxa miuraensis]